MSLARPMGLIVAYGNLGNLALAVSCWHTLAVNVTLLPPAYRPRWGARIGLALAGAYFFLLAAITGYVALAAPRAGQTLPDQPLIVYVNSYHEGYPPSDDVMAGIRDVLQGAGIRLEVLFLDAKRRPSERDVAAAAASARARILASQPRALIVSDDAAVQHLVVPFFRDGPLPVVFCGVNWSADHYGLPTAFVTGMIEVLPTVETLSTLRATYPGLRRIAVISEQSEAEASNRRALEPLLAAAGYETTWTMVSTFVDWKTAFVRANADADAIFLPTNGAIRDWDRAAAEAIVHSAIRVPVFTNDDFMLPYAVFGRVKVPREQGEWAARRSLEILGGRSPASIPLARNQHTRVLVNRTLAARIGFVPSPTLERELAGERE